ncbi:MAG TPA: Rieske 2Fe-2S domain-containing protein, partial [Rudaea sp.]|nr:Rieske 2Fe-2S domain-containing protein [Rudaea sp.]
MIDRSPPAAHPLERTLPRDAYVSAAIFAAERERIFAREWVLVGREESVPATGDYLDVDVLGESILVVRGGDGALRAFFNVCRHRGSALVPRAIVDPANEGVPVGGCKGA